MGLFQQNLRGYKVKSEKPKRPTVIRNVAYLSTGFGGGWGYSPQSVEAIRFACDSEVVIGGVGLYGGRGEYTATVSLQRDPEDFTRGSLGPNNEILVEVSHHQYECESK